MLATTINTTNATPASSTTALLDEIRRLHADQHTGILSLVGDGGQRIDVFFCEGMIEAVSSSGEAHRLGSYLLRDGYMLEGDLAAVQSEAQQEKIFFGEAVVRKKLVGQGDVGAAVRSQALELLQYALRNRFVVDSFRDTLRSYFAPARISFSHVLLELSRSSPELVDLDPEARICLAPDADVSMFPWYPQELCVLGELKQPKTFEALLAATGLTQLNLRKILGVFERVRIIQTATSDTESSNALVLQTEFPFEHLIPVVTNAVLDEKLGIARNGSSYTSEQFKNLKIKLREASPEVPLKVFTVSSPDSLAGKSLVSASLAFSFSEDPGRHVLIVDCDLRNPSLEKYLGVTSDPGLLQYMSNGPLGPHCFIRRLENLYFMTAGGMAANPIEILSMRKMKQLIEYLKTIFDVIILDAPPYAPIADARVVTALSDGLIMVIRSGKTTYANTDHAMKAVDRKKLLGIVLNEAQPLPFQKYQPYGYQQYGTDRLRIGDSTNGNRRSGTKNYLES